MEQNHRFFQNRACEFFPCHKGVAEEDFNCLFCYCPLYALGRRCGGNYEYTQNGVKSCMNCAFPHVKQHYDRILERYQDIQRLVERSDREDA